MKENIDFLKNLHFKTTNIVSSTLTTNISKTTYRSSIVYFRNYVITNEDFEKIFKIIQEELLLIIPKENLMGFVDGYTIYGLDGELILMFGKENLPKGKDLTKIFDYCHTEQNKLILNELQKKKKWRYFQIKDKFEDYDY